MPQWGTKDHNRIARVLKGVKPNTEKYSDGVERRERYWQWEITVTEFANYFGIDSPFFNKEKFLINCGYQKLTQMQIIEVAATRLSEVGVVASNDFIRAATESLQEYLKKE